VEKNRESVGLIHRNIATLRYQDRASVRLADAYRWVRGFHPNGPQPIAVFLDPPYREYEIRRGAMRQMITLLQEKLPPDSVIVLEAGRNLDGEMLANCERWDIRRYGETQIAIRVLPDNADATSQTADDGRGIEQEEGARLEEGGDA
jgi:16S rRNA (guanine966-N2)-methyltransferase